MDCGLSLKKIWFDDHMTELSVTVNNQSFTFTNEVYIANDDVKRLIQNLDNFKYQYCSGSTNIKWGEVGDEYANGAFIANLHYSQLGILHLTTHQQSEFFDFKGQREANEAKVHLTSEPALLDNFIKELENFDSGISDNAKLVCIHKF